MSGLDAYRGLRVLVTGHTGFKGSWLSLWLGALGAEVTGLALDPPTRPSHAALIGLSGRVMDRRVDVRDAEGVLAAVREARPEVVFHLAAQALIGRGIRAPRETFETNTMGTFNVLEAALSTPSVRAVVCATSDKVYDDLQPDGGYSETDRMGGDEPYSASKVGAEAVFQALASSRPVRPGMVAVRAGNVIGGGDWAADRLVPDCLRSWSKGREVVLRRPGATRPWQHVLDALSAYLWLGMELFRGGCAVDGMGVNVGPDTSGTVREVVEALAAVWPKAAWRALEGPGGLEEAQHLALCTARIGALGWSPVLSLRETALMTARWHRDVRDAPSLDVAARSLADIARFEALGAERGAIWA